jgi:NAD(P)-dependent dehydrogenase (short-subunit alcohol dehydrogenase family)
MATDSTPNSRSTAVTGAGGGLGPAVAVQLARTGYRVFGVAGNDEDIAEVEAASADANSQHRGCSPTRARSAP